MISCAGFDFEGARLLEILMMGSVGRGDGSLHEEDEGEFAGDAGFLLRIFFECPDEAGVWDSGGGYGIGETVFDVELGAACGTLTVFESALSYIVNISNQCLSLSFSSF